MKRLDSGFYKGYAQQKEKERQEDEARKQYGLEHATPVVINTSKNNTAIWRWLGAAAMTIGKALFYVIITVLSSVGLTTLINEPVREQLLQIFLGVMKQ